MAEMTVARRAGAAEGTLELAVSGPLTIAEAARLKEVLLEALAEAPEVRLDLAGVDAMDLSSLQIICAAHGSAEQEGKGFTVAAEANEVYRKVVNEAGFQCHVGCQRDRESCIWIGGKC